MCSTIDEKRRVLERYGNEVIARGGDDETRRRRKGGAMIDTKRIVMRLGVALVLTAAACSQPAEPIKIVAVDLSHEIDQHNEPRSAREMFAPSSTVYACVAIENKGTGTLAARWTDPEGKVLAEQTQAINATQPDPNPQRFELHLKPEGGWPISEGRYKVVITLDGKDPKTREFGIR